jgi:hypothetical protein
MVAVLHLLGAERDWRVVEGEPGICQRERRRVQHFRGCDGKWLVDGMAIGPALRSIKGDALDTRNRQPELGPLQSSNPNSWAESPKQQQRDRQRCDLIDHSQSCSRARPALTQNIHPHVLLLLLLPLHSVTASRLPAHALLVICTSCLIATSSASYCKHSLPLILDVQREIPDP